MLVNVETRKETREVKLAEPNMGKPTMAVKQCFTYVRSSPHEVWRLQSIHDVGRPYKINLDLN